MNIFIEVLVACVILSCVTLGLYMQYKEDERSEFEKLPAFDYSYSTGVVDAKVLVDDYFSKTYSPCDKEAFTFYLLCLLSRHKTSKLYRLYFYKIYSIAQSDYGLNVDASFLSKYRVVSCVHKGKPNFYAFLKYTDCLNYNEFICLYRFVVYYVKRNKLPKHISLQEFCLLIDFLCRSRFAGNLGHDKVGGINFIYLMQVFVKISHKISGSYLSDGISSDSYSAKEFIRLRGHYMSELQGFYELNGLNYCVPKYQFAPKHLLDDLYFCEEKEQTLF